MKLLFILPTNMISGGNFVTYVQAHALQDQGHQVCIAFMQTNNGLQVKGFPGFRLRTTAFWEVAQTQEFFDVAVSTFWDSWYNLGDVNAAHFLSFVQSDERKFYENPLAPEKALVEQTYRFSKIGIITEARWIVDMLTKEMSHSRVAYAPNGIDLDLFQPHGALRWPKSKVPRVLIEGPGSTAFKRVAFAFEVARELGSEIEIVYVSTDGVIKKEWRKLAREVVVKAPLHEMPSIYRSCDILLKLSSVEGFFGPPLEMMACGGTSVVSRVTGYDEYIEDGVNALTVAIDDREGAITALQKLVRNDELRKKLSEAGLKTAQSMSWKTRTPLFSRAIDQLIQTSQGMTSEARVEMKQKKLEKTAILVALRQENESAHVRMIQKILSPPKKLYRLLFR